MKPQKIILVTERMWGIVFVTRRCAWSCSLLWACLPGGAACGSRLCLPWTNLKFYQCSSRCSTVGALAAGYYRMGAAFLVSHVPKKVSSTIHSVCVQVKHFAGRTFNMQPELMVQEVFSAWQSTWRMVRFATWRVHCTLCIAQQPSIVVGIAVVRTKCSTRQSNIIKTLHVSA